MAARMRLMSRGERAALACVVCALAAGYSAYALLKHWHFDSSYDLAIYDQAIWHLSRFERPASSIRSLPNVFGDHFHPIIALFAPLYWVAPFPETLIVAQAILLAASVVPVFLFARDRLPYGPALAMCLAYGLFWGMQQTAIFDVHEAAFAPLAVGLLLLAMERRRRLWFWAAAAVVLAVKEDLAPFLVFVGGYLFVRGERRTGGILLAGSLVAFVAEVAVVIPAASVAGEYGYGSAYADVWRQPWLVPVKLVTPPVKMLTAFLWVAPFALLPLASPLSLLLAPFAPERFLSSSVNHWGTIYHYSAPLAPIVAMSAADGLARIGRRISDQTTRRRTIAIMAGVSVLLASLLPGHQPLWRLFSSRPYLFDAIDRTGPDAIGVVPPDASVVAQTAVAPHMAHRHDLFRLDPEGRDADYVIAVPDRSPWPNLTAADVRALLDERRRRGYAVIFERDGWVVLRRGGR
ncbi:MAG: hypothetical protein DMF94_10300 [Acidobacteria bacterium]|nr:MAG: hypothetical protein DMF94_10300 [Acidobacteriota bacterium]